MGRIQHIVSAQQFHRSVLDYLLDKAAEMELFVQYQDQKGIQPISEELAAIGKKYEACLKGKQLIVLFFEPSTRTQASFIMAAHRLGMNVFNSVDPNKFSSVVKGEKFQDHIRVLGGYGDVIVMRHHEKGSAALAAKVSEKPIINGGDGPGEHPTQTLLDLYTLQKHRKAHGKKIDGIKLAFVGDLRYGRTVHSLAKALRCYNDVELIFVAQPELQIDEGMKNFLEENGIRYALKEHLDEVLPQVDAVYMTRAQTERFSGIEIDFSNVTLSGDNVGLLPEHAIIMHPLPRRGEIEESVDKDHRAKYFEQARDGMFVRMALLYHVVLAAFQTNPDGSYKLPENHMFIPCSKTQPSV